MTTSVPPKKNAAMVLYVGLVSQASRPQFQSSPTIAAGDFKVSTDGGALANLATLPTVTPAAGKAVKISLSADEMNGDDVTVVCSDATGAEWDDLVIGIKTAARWLDDLAFPNTTGRGIDVDATGGVEVGSIVAAASDGVADALLDRANAIETGLTLRQAHRLEAAAAAGKLSGAATTSVTLRNAIADSKNRIVATVDSDGNRTAIATDVT